VSHRLITRKLAAFAGIVAASALLFAVSCSSVSDPSLEGSGSVFELRMRWARWRTDGPKSYTYELRRTCFCTLDAVTPARVAVRDGGVVDARAVESGRTLPLELFDPIDSLFAYAIDAAERARPVEVSYDLRLSYPTFLEIGTLANDAGVRYEVSALVAR
jgi:hypothetical protein